MSLCSCFVDGAGFHVREGLSRLPLKMDAPEKILCQAHGQARPIADFLHENGNVSLPGCCQLMLSQLLCLTVFFMHEFKVCDRNTCTGKGKNGGNLILLFSFIRLLLLSNSCTQLSCSSRFPE